MSNTPASSPVESLAPPAVWRFFAGLAATPRPSKHEELARDHILALAEAHGFETRQDPAGNLVVQVPASSGRESAPIIVLQGHLDIVPEANAGKQHDFRRDPIQLIVTDDPDSGQQVVRADGTTLGADNGIGLAMALAAATEPDLVHGPLELLCTVDEEAGMTGAKALAPDFFRGRLMLNLDSEEDDAIYMGCAGGMDTTLTWRLDRSPVPRDGEACRVRVTGLRGGHSGGDIHENRGNAIKLLARTLGRIRQDALRIAAIDGGGKRNVIPREASATVWAPKGTPDALRKAAAQVRDEAADESYEEHLAIAVEGIAPDEVPDAFSAEDSRRLMAALAALPHGVLGMHPKVDGLVQSSNNVATISTDRADGGSLVEVGLLSRSSTKSLLHLVADQLAAVGRLAGAAVRHAGEYPGWAPNPDSPTLALCRRVYETLFDEPPKVAAIHAGLECGIISERVGEMDMVSFGPTIRGAHSPDERVYVASVQKSWRLLVAVLAELAKG